MDEAKRIRLTALERVHMKAYIESLQLLLDYPIEFIAPPSPGLNESRRVRPPLPATGPPAATPP